MNLELDITPQDPAWETQITDSDSRTLEDIALKTIKQACLLKDIPQEIEISLVLTNDADIQILNKQYRDKDKPTNVLSFPQQEWHEDEGEICAGIPFLSLGDIIMAIETIEQESLEQKKPFADHFKHLFVHGLLHLLGYDHIENSEAEHMERLEITILAKFGIKNPYETPIIMS